VQICVVALSSVFIQALFTIFTQSWK